VCNDTVPIVCNDTVPIVISAARFRSDGEPRTRGS